MKSSSNPPEARTTSVIIAQYYTLYLWSRSSLEVCNIWTVQMGIQFVHCSIVIKNKANAHAAFRYQLVCYRQNSAVLTGMLCTLASLHRPCKAEQLWCCLLPKFSWKTGWPLPNLQHLPWPGLFCGREVFIYNRTIWCGRGRNVGSITPLLPQAKTHCIPKM